MSAHFQKGKKNNVAFVFSCPGRHEKAADCPAAKATGTNLRRLLAKLCEALNRNDLPRENITIANAWDRVEYKELTSRSEATDREIKENDNIYRLSIELSHVTEFIVFCGDKARIASEQLAQKNIVNSSPRFLFLEHLGTRGLNSISSDLYGREIISADKQIEQGRNSSKRKIQFENTDKRLDVVVKSILEQLEGKSTSGSA